MHSITNNLKGVRCRAPQQGGINGAGQGGAGREGAAMEEEEAVAAGVKAVEPRITCDPSRKEHWASNMTCVTSSRPKSSWPTLTRLLPEAGMVVTRTRESATGSMPKTFSTLQL